MEQLFNKENLGFYLQIAGTIFAGLFVFFKFNVEVRHKRQEHFDNFILKALELKHLSNEVIDKLEDGLLQILFRHKTGIDTTIERRILYEEIISNSDGAISYRDIDSNIKYIEFINKRPIIRSLKSLYGWLSLYVIFLFFLSWIYLQDTRNLWNLLLVVCYVIMVFFVAERLLSLYRLRKKFQK